MAPGLLSPWHVAILVLVMLLVFGPSRLPELGRALGRGGRELRDSISGSGRDVAELEPALPADRPQARDTVG